MKVNLAFTIISVVLFINVSVSQTLYKSKSNESIILLNDSTIKFDFSYPNIACNAKFNRYKNYLEIIYLPYTVDVDTLKNEICSGFYIENADVYLKSNGVIIAPDSVIVDFIPFSFDTKIIQFEFRQKEQGLNPFVLSNIAKGCYRLSYTFSSCALIDISSMNRIEMRKNGRYLFIGEKKFKLVKCK